MAKKDTRRNIIIGILLVAVLAFAFFQLRPAPDTGVEDQGVQFRVFAYDENKELVGELTQAGFEIPAQTTVQFPGGPAKQNISFIKIEHTITNIGDTIVTITDLIGGVPGETNVYDPALDVVTQTAVLAPSEQLVGVSDFINIESLPFGAVTFRLDVVATFPSATGEPVPLDPPAFGTKIIQFSADQCIDGTPEGECVVDGASGFTTGQKCEGFTIIDAASTCGCTDPTYQENGETCELITCSDGTLINECIDSSVGPGKYNPQFCDADGNTIPGCGVSLCGTAATVCPDDYYGNPPIGCDINNECEYNIYDGELSVSLGEPGASGATLFRTTDPTYSAGSAIAYANTCGNTLNKFSYLSSGGSSADTCDIYLDTILAENIPCTVAGDNCVFGTRAGVNRICYEEVGQVQFITYSPDSNAPIGDGSLPEGVNEVLC